MKTYSGGCHCGTVRYEVTTDLTNVIACNCSICSRTAGLLTFVEEKQFVLKSGDTVLSDYQFNKKNVHHLFCSKCGIRSFTRGSRPDGAPMVSINVRCLDGVDVSALSVTHFDGKNI